MKRIFAAAAIAALTTTTAFAADLAPYYEKAPAPPPVVGINWTGFYIGAFGGYGWSNELRGSIPGVVAVTGSSDAVNGGFGGGAIGYNWQMPGSQFVGGIEVDAAGGNIGYGVSGLGLDFRDQINSFGSVTGRLGAAFGPALFYVKGGYAWASNKMTIDVAGVNVYNRRQVHPGWTIGGGAEWMFAPCWSVKGEYMYADFGDKNYLADVVPPGVNLGGSFHTVKAGLNYHFY